MFNNVALDVAIGLVFIYLLYSLLATIIQEIIATAFAFRAKILEKAILRMLEDGNSSSGVRVINLFIRKNFLKDKRIAAWFYAHPLVKYLGENNYHSKPSYLSAQNFSKVMIDLLKGFENNSTNDVQQLNDSIQQGVIHHLPIDLAHDPGSPAIAALRAQFGSNMQNGKGDPNNTSKINPDTTLFLQSLWKEAEADVDKFRQKLEQWFNDTMERATGWYKKHTQIVLLVVGFILATIFNVDSIFIARKLMKDPKLREQMVQSANNYLEKNKQLADQLKNSDTNSASYKLIKNDYNDISARAKRLMDSAQGIIDDNINIVNKVLGLGWTWEKGRPAPKWNRDQDWTIIFGWLITALAISLGAPFWFDLLNKLMKLRGSGTKIDSAAKNNQGATNIPAAPAPVSVNVNTQTGQEAVG